MPEGQHPNIMLHSLRVNILCGIVHILVLNLILASTVEEKGISMDDELQSPYEDMDYRASLHMRAQFAMTRELVRGFYIA